MHSTSFFLSHIQLDFSCFDPAAFQGLCASLGPCRKPLVQTLERHSLELTREWEIWLDGESLGDASSALHALPLLERAIYDRLPGWIIPGLLLHAGSVAFGNATAVFVGPSGAGKSTLTKSAVKSGARYYSDDLTILEDRHLWGIPRAIQFDPVAPGSPAVPLLEDCDLTSYPFINREWKKAVLPLFELSEDQVAFAPSPAGGTSFFFIEQAQPAALEPVPPTEALALLHQGLIRQQGSETAALSAWIRQENCHRLRWEDPAQAIAQVRRLLQPSQ